MTEVKFHAEDWMNYYKAKIDEEDLKDSFDNEDCSKVTSIRFDGETFNVELESDVSSIICIETENDETGEEEELDVEIGANFSYSVDYKINKDLERYLEDFNKALNEAINADESTFEIEVPYFAGEAYDVRIDDVEVYETYGNDIDEDDVYPDVLSFVRSSLAHPTDSRHAGDHIQPPSDKEVRFICTIPTDK